MFNEASGIIYTHWNRCHFENRKLLTVLFQQTEDDELLHLVGKFHFDRLINDGTMII